MQNIPRISRWVSLLAFVWLTNDAAILAAPVETVIDVATAHSSLNLFVGKDHRVYERSYGTAGKNSRFSKEPEREAEFYPQYGDGFILEPALMANHVDGNTSTDLGYVNHTTETVDTNVTLTRIELKDPAYPFFVTLCFKAYAREDLIEAWTEIHHEEDGTVILSRFASSAPLVKAKGYWLTQFCGEYQREATLEEEKLGTGMKVLDSKIGVRSTKFLIPSFILALDHAADEENGEVIGGSLAWSGSFQLAFEIDPHNNLRALCGINPFGEQYHLKRDEIFKTPAMLWTWSDHGKGQVTRNFHNWARRYGIRDGEKPRPVLLNNWEATGFNFDEQTVVSLFDGAKELNVDLFLLDDGWFGNAHPRNNDDAGLGDWQVNKKKLPQGLGYLASEANKRGLKFGIWLEPEMVNPVSDLFEKHPDWAIQQPHRELELSRNQLDLDLSNPQVRDFSWSVVDQTLSVPNISYLKWDANRFVTQPGSTYLPPSEQSDLLIDYNFALYDIMKRMAEKFPDTIAMACSGGGGRVDYGTLKYFHLFWPSDNTDPRSRVFIQWGFDHFFPACATGAHVTHMGNRPTKFAFDVAMSGALGLDLDARKLPESEKREIATMVAFYKKEIQHIVEQGDLYRLESPYGHPRAALDYVLPDQSQAVLFVYQLENAKSVAVKPRGLNPAANYRIREVNLVEGTKSQLAVDGKVIGGATLMRDGFVPPCEKKFDSAMIELTVEK